MTLQTDTPVSPSAELIAADLAALKAFNAELPPWLSRDAAGKMTQVRAPSPSEQVLYFDRRADRVALAGLNIFTAYPADPQRWQGALAALSARRTFVLEIKPGYDDARKNNSADAADLIVTDNAALNAWEAKLDDLLGQALAAADFPDTDLPRLYLIACQRPASKKGLSAAQRLSALRAPFETLVTRFPEAKILGQACDLYAKAFEAADPTGYSAELARLSRSASPIVARWAAGKLNVDSGKSKPLELQFTALDGRVVDLAKLRGKAVLLDFWATWCGPCKAEIPHLKEVYAQYHDQGFEVIGISLDTDQQKLIDYCREKDLPWPQYFDGKGWDSDLAANYAVRAIPSVFLLDREGKIASTDVRGAKLAPAVRGLLNL